MTDRMPKPELRDRLRWRSVTLSVTDIERAAAFWTKSFGLLRRDCPAPGIALGTTRHTLIELQPGAQTPVLKGYAGMYHVALSVAGQAAFARAIRRLQSHGIRFSGSDHTMSKSIYVRDPDGHAIEIILETPERFARFQIWEHGFAMIDTSGIERSGREPLNIDAEISAVNPDDGEACVDDDIRISHLHLHVAHLNPAVSWFATFGFHANPLLPNTGMADMSMGGSFPHRLAVNVWAGIGVAPAPRLSARLLSYRIETTDQTLFRRICANAHESESLDVFRATDPAGAELNLSMRNHRDDRD